MPMRTKRSPCPKMQKFTNRLGKLINHDHGMGWERLALGNRNSKFGDRGFCSPKQNATRSPIAVLHLTRITL